MIEALLVPFQFPFMQQAFAIAALVAVPAGLLSCFLVLRGWALMGDAVSHAVLPGVVLAYLAGLPLAVGAFAAGMVCALSTGFLSTHSRVKPDTVLGVVFSGMFGLGVLLYGIAGTDLHLDHILFGDILGAGWEDIAQSAVIAAVVVGVLLAKWRDFKLYVFDAQHAAAIGLNVPFLHYGLLILLSLTIVGALQAVGIILVVALLVAPGAIAFMATRRLAAMLAVAVAIALSTSLAGVYLSFFLNSAPAPTIVLLMTACFIAVFALTQLRALRLRAG